MDKIKVGFIGLGKRGVYQLTKVIGNMEDVQVSAVCDASAERLEKGMRHLRELPGSAPRACTDYREVVRAEDVDAVVISSAWESHIPIALEALNAGKYVGIEVGGAYAVEDCWELVRASERSGTPCMMLENCCYGKYELMALHMARLGIFGEIVHCAGGYRHDLRQEIAGGGKTGHYRLRNYLGRNCENYPTHELGPIAKVLDINRGNRMLSLSSVASKAAGMEAFAAEHREEYPYLEGKRFAQGDVVTTTIRCARGETITLTLDTTLPRFYSRNFEVHGTRGMYQEDTRSVFLDNLYNEQDEVQWQKQWNNAEKYFETYAHPIWKRYLQEGVQEGHDGMDWLVFRAFFESVRERTATPIDVYDTASWMCISALSEQSIACGGAPVGIPDFTSGRWLTGLAQNTGRYSLDTVYPA